MVVSLEFVFPLVVEFAWIAILETVERNRLHWAKDS